MVKFNSLQLHNRMSALINIDAGAQCTPLRFDSANEFTNGGDEVTPPFLSESHPSTATFIFNPPFSILNLPLT